MDRNEAAKRLDGNEYRQEGSPELFAAMKESGLVAVFGASDDLVELRGAIEDEIGAYEGASFAVTPAGLLTNRCDNDCCPYHQMEAGNAVTIEAVWCDFGEFAWLCRTEIPHARFIITEDGDPFCQGIVFALADAVPAESPQ